MGYVRQTSVKNVRQHPRRARRCDEAPQPDGTGVKKDEPRSWMDAEEFGDAVGLVKATIWRLCREGKLDDAA
jgi:hypothetical protein